MYRLVILERFNVIQILPPERQQILNKANMAHQLGKVKKQYLRDELEPGRDSAAAVVELSEELGQVGASHPLGGGHFL